jgi:hypothetical protein
MCSKTAFVSSVGTSRRIRRCDSQIASDAGRRESLGALRAWYRRQVADGVAQINTDLVGLGPQRPTMAIERDEDQALAMLGHAISEAVQDARLHPVAECLKGLVQAGEDRAIVPAWQVGDILDEDRRRRRCSTIAMNEDHRSARTS